MLAQNNDYYSSAGAQQQHHQQQQQQQHEYEQHQLHSGLQHHHEQRPKIFTLETHLPPGLHGLVHHSAAMHDYQHMVHGTPQHQQHAITPQQQQHHHHHQQQQQHPGDFDHEPLLMSMHNPAAHYYSQSAMNAQMLHVSADYPAQPPSVTSASSSTSGSKRSREDLNMKEKKRMFKLNDRINQLKDILDEAGVQCKKNKQSILDHTHHYIGMLRSNLLIAQQKAERAEKQTEAFRAQAQKSSAASGADVLFKRCFDQSSTARLVTDLALQPITYNHAFLGHSGLTEQILKKKDLLRQFLCVDSARLDQIVSTALDTLKATSAIVQARTAGGDAALTLVASVITDDFGKAVSIEFSLIPFEISSDASLPASYHSAMSPKREMQEASPSGVSDLSVV